MRADLLDLTEEQRGIRDLAREFAAKEIAPFISQWDEDAYFEPALVTKMGELGFLGMLIPEEYEGLALDTSTYLVALEEIAVVDATAIANAADLRVLYDSLHSIAGRIARSGRVIVVARPAEGATSPAQAAACAGIEGR